ncbi:MAG: hypothetical protein U0R71_13920 [Solirubrobacterales bacterium]
MQLGAALGLFLFLAGCIAAAAAWGSFGSTAATSAGNVVAAAPDFVAPKVTATTIAKTTGYSAGYVKKGGTYYVYANVEDKGNPASGVSTVTANVSSLTSGQTAVALSAGSFTAEGVTYNMRSASLTAGSTLVEGTYSYALTTTDLAGNTATTSGLTVQVDNLAISAANLQTTNGGSIAGRAEQGDRITYTFSEQPDPGSILAGWDGAATNVVVRLNNATNDTVTVFNAANTAQLPLGTIGLGRSDYTTANRTFGATGTASTMELSGNQLTITLGTQSGAATTAAGTGTLTWTPSATATDRAGNAMSTTAKAVTGQKAF